MCRTREQAKQGNELPKKGEFPSLELFWVRGGNSLLQVVWNNELDPSAMHGNGLNDPGQVPSSPNNSIIIDPGGQGLVSEEEESVFKWLSRAQLPAVLCHWLDRFQVILFGKNSNREAPSATGFEPLPRVSRFQTFLAKFNSQLHHAGSGKVPEVSCGILLLPGEREVAKALHVFSC